MSSSICADSARRRSTRGEKKCDDGTARAYARARLRARRARLDIVLLDLRARAVEAEDSLARVHLLVHSEHGLEIVVVKIPDRRVFEILLEGHRKAIGDVERAAAHPARAQQHADDALLGVLRNAVVVVDRAEQHERVHDNDEARGRRRGLGRCGDRDCALAVRHARAGLGPCTIFPIWATAPANLERVSQSYEFRMSDLL